MKTVTKSDRKIISADFVRMGTMTIAQPLPAAGTDQLDPFLLLHHAGPYENAPGEADFYVPPHPHRGFCPVTFVFDGRVLHKDSLGNEEIVGPGGVQWITAARGIVHSEGLDPDFVKEGGSLELIQLWINLPAAEKMNPPAYFALDRDKIPFVSPDGKSRLNVISGRFQDANGPVSEPGIRALTAEMPAGGNLTIPTENGKQALVYVLKGELEIEGEIVGKRQLIDLGTEGGDFEIRSREDSLFLYLDARPLNEKVSSHGPFVMNSQTEIMEAMRDYEAGKMGFLPG